MNKIIRKFLVGILAVSVLFGAAGCGEDIISESSKESEEESSEISESSVSEISVSEISMPEVIQKNRLTVYVYEDKDTEGFWSAVAEEYEKIEERIEVEIIADENIASKVRSDILSGKIPDVIYLPSNDTSGVTKALIADKALADISDVIEKISDSTAKGAVDGLFSKPYGTDKNYIAPFGCKIGGIWYNAAAFSEDFEFSGSIDDFEGLASGLKKGENLIAFAGEEFKSLKSIVAPIIYMSAGKNACDAVYDITKSVWKDENVSNAINTIYSFASKKTVSATSVEYDEADVVWAIARGDAAFGILTDAEAAYSKAVERYGTPNVEATEKDKEFSENLKAMRLTRLNTPTVGDGERVVFAEMGAVYIPLESKNIEPAKRFIEFLYSDTVKEISAEKGIYAPAKEIVGENEIIYCYRLPMMLGATDDFENIFYENIANLLNGKTTVKAVIENMTTASGALEGYKIK